MAGAVLNDRANSEVFEVFGKIDPSNFELYASLCDSDLARDTDTQTPAQKLILLSITGKLKSFHADCGNESLRRKFVKQERILLDTNTADEEVAPQEEILQEEIPQEEIPQENEPLLSQKKHLSNNPTSILLDTNTADEEVAPQDETLQEETPQENEPLLSQKKHLSNNPTPIHHKRAHTVDVACRDKKTTTQTLDVDESYLNFSNKHRSFWRQANFGRLFFVRNLRIVNKGAMVNDTEKSLDSFNNSINPYLGWCSFLFYVPRSLHNLIFLVKHVVPWFITKEEAKFSFSQRLSMQMYNRGFELANDVVWLGVNVINFVVWAGTFSASLLTFALYLYDFALLSAKRYIMLRKFDQQIAQVQEKMEEVRGTKRSLEKNGQRTDIEDALLALLQAQGKNLLKQKAEFIRDNNAALGIAGLLAVGMGLLLIASPGLQLFSAVLIVSVCVGQLAYQRYKHKLPELKISDDIFEISNPVIEAGAETEPTSPVSTGHQSSVSKPPPHQRAQTETALANMRANNTSLHRSPKA
jgi:hypothetical protein